MSYSYETVLITVPDIADSGLKTIKSKIESTISKSKGEVSKLDDWGIKKLAYEISHNRKGKYLIYYYKAEPSVVKEIERDLRIDERVLRFLTVRKEEKKIKEKKEKKI